MHSQLNLKPSFSQDSGKAGGQTSLGSTSRLIPRTISTKGSVYTKDDENRDLEPSRSSSTTNSNYTEEEDNRNLEPWGMGDLSFAKF